MDDPLESDGAYPVDLVFFVLAQVDVHLGR